MLRGAAKSRQTEMSSKQAGKRMLATRDRGLQMNLPLAVIHRTFNMPASFGFLRRYMNATCKNLASSTALVQRRIPWKDGGLKSGWERSEKRRDETSSIKVKRRDERDRKRERERERNPHPLWLSN